MDLEYDDKVVLTISLDNGDRSEATGDWEEAKSIMEQFLHLIGEVDKGLTKLRGCLSFRTTDSWVVVPWARVVAMAVVRPKEDWVDNE